MKYLTLIATVLLSMISVTAFADEAAAPAQQGGSGMLFFMLILLGMMYLLVWRPQQKRTKEHANLVNSIQKGDEVMTQGGLLGKVAEVFESHLAVELNETNVVTLQKAAISATLPKGTMKSVTEK